MLQRLFKFRLRIFKPKLCWRRLQTKGRLWQRCLLFRIIWVLRRGVCQISQPIHISVNLIQNFVFTRECVESCRSSKDCPRHAKNCIDGGCRSYGCLIGSDCARRERCSPRNVCKAPRRPPPFGRPRPPPPFRPRPPRPRPIPRPPPPKY